ncbi:MAG TPA: divalent metal cation transporter [Ktedonobacteraceae bacterium]|nr:divalent metal cation transporter [Ktedonobacteraceae bacterium]
MDEQHSIGSPAKKGSSRISRVRSASDEEIVEKTPHVQESLIKRTLKILGPGFITGASDDDPSGIGTYTAAGASLGFTTLWVALITFPLMVVVQFICAKVGMISGRGLAGILKRYYSPWFLYPAIFALVLANTINASADLGAIAAAINLLIPIPIAILVVPIALIILVLQIWGSYRLISNVFRWLTLALFAYLISVFFASPDWGNVLRGTFLPTLHLDSSYLATMVALLGTTISPYLFFWQTSEEVEEEIKMGRKLLRQRKGATHSEIRHALWDVNIGMFLSNLVMYAIILATASTLFKAGKHDVQSAIDAAQALRPLAGDAARILFAVGVIGSGFLAVPVLSGSAAYALSEAFGWKYGLEEKLGRAKRFYAIIIAITVVSLLMNYIGINPIQALFWAAVINGVLAPPLLAFIMHIASRKEIMGNKVNGLVLNLIGWGTTLVMAVAAVAMFITPH